MRRLCSALVLLLAGCISGVPEGTEADINLDPGADLNLIEIEDPAITIRIEFVILQDDIDAHPEIMTEFKRALNVWTQLLPLETVLLTEPSVDFTAPTLYLSRPYIIRVRTITSDYALPNTLGMWMADNRELSLVTDALESVPNRIYSTCLHELGHVFGLRHIVTAGSSDGVTGDVILSVDTSSLVMYPRIVDGQSQDKLSTLEVDLAKYNVLTGLRSVRGKKLCHFLDK